MKKAILLPVFVAGLIFFGVMFCFAAQAAETDLLVSEIMYDLSGADANHEWIEAYNSGLDNVEIITGSGGQAWRFFDGSNHTLNLTQGTTTISGGEFFIITGNAVQFLLDYPDFVGTVFNCGLTGGCGVTKLVELIPNKVDSISTGLLDNVFQGM